MEISVLIAKIASLVYLSAAIGAIISKDYYRRVLEDSFKNTALTYLMGFMAVISGLLIVSYHNNWVKNWTVLVTLIGWLAVTKGMLLIAFPSFVQSFSERILAGKSMKLFPYIALFLGLLFGYFGFTA